MKRYLLCLVSAATIAGCAAGNVSNMSDGAAELHIFKPFASSVTVCASTTDFVPQQPSSNTLGYRTFIIPCKGRFSYFFLVDDEVFVPDCMYRENDDFGRYNCLFAADL